MISYKTITQCRACQSTNLNKLFSIGDQFVSDFVDKEHIYTGHKVPITLVQCADCTLIQQLHTAPQDFLYTRHYWYRSGTTDTMRKALKDIVTNTLNHVKIYPGDIVLDIGSNDGTLLRCYKYLEFQPMTDPGEAIINCDYNWPGRYGPITIGVEPAKNMQTEGSKGIDLLINDFWTFDNYYDGVMNSDVKAVIGSIKPKIITAIGMFYDLDDPNQFIADIARALHPEGIFIAQLMCAKQMYQLGDVGNLAHEHLEFYTLESLRQLFRKHGLSIVDIEENDVNGGSYRLYVKHSGSPITNEKADKIIDIFRNETHPERDLHDLYTWEQWYRRVCVERDRCMSFLQEVIREGKKVIVLGASTKGNVILQFYDINSEMIQYASDKSSEKWTKYTVGTGIRIINEMHARELKPDYMLILPYTFVEEFKEREKELRDNGCKFIVPLPHFQVI